jgi:ribonuclease D
VAQKLVASADDLERLARDDAADIPALHGWRHKLFGADALALKHGRLALTVGRGAVKVIDVAAADGNGPIADAGATTAPRSRPSGHRRRQNLDRGR